MPDGMKENDRFPEPMVPSAVVLLDALPLTANGKVDRRALIARDVARPRQIAVPVFPRNPIEEVLVEHWCTVLGIESVSVHVRWRMKED